MQITSQTLPGSGFATFRGAAPQAQASLPNHEDKVVKNDWDSTLGRRGFTAGLSQGLATGALLDACCLGLPVLFGYAWGGAVGAVVGGAIMPVGLGAIMGLDGYANPHKYVKG